MYVCKHVQYILYRCLLPIYVHLYCTLVNIDMLCNIIYIYITIYACDEEYGWIFSKKQWGINETGGGGAVTHATILIESVINPYQ